jgi:hypothetical protein
VGYTVDQVNPLGIWATGPRWEWPASAGAARWRGQPHPGVTLWVLMVPQGRRAKIAVEADAICALPAGVADSVLVAAPNLAIREFMAALSRAFQQ